VCVIGAGAAGISLARDLAYRGFDVSLLDAGGLGFETQTHNLYSGQTIGQTFSGLTDGRFRGLGGTTSQWGGQILPIDAHIFEPRAWVANSGWPISRSDLDTWYLKALELEGLSSAEDDTNNLWRALGLTPPDYGEGLMSTFSKFCPETNFATLYKSDLIKHPKLLTVLHANVCELVPNSKFDTIQAVKIRSLNGRESHIRARTFVFCGGGIETVRLLLQPNSETNQPLFGNQTLLGQHFMDHPVSDLAKLIPKSLDNPNAYFDYCAYNSIRYHPKLKLPVVLQQHLETLDVCGTINVNLGGIDHLAIAYETVRKIRTQQYSRLKVSDLMHLISHLPTLAWHKLPYGQAAYRQKNNQTYHLTLHTEQSPDSPSRLSLGSGRDRLGLIPIKVDWHITDQELYSLRQFARHAKTVFESRGLAEVEFIEGFEDDDTIKASMRESYHHIGGTRMSESAHTGIVDKNLKMFGVDNAYICSTSVFPSAGFVNPTHTLIALGLRLAEHLSTQKL
jgi:choline dehydrogenase-like flavoprotein